MFQSRSCYPSYSSTQETSCGIRTFHDHQLPPGSHREEIQGWKVAALLGTQASALILQHKATSTHQFGFLGPKVTHIKKIVYELCMSAVTVRLYWHAGVPEPSSQGHTFHKAPASAEICWHPGGAFTLCFWVQFERITKIKV